MKILVAGDRGYIGAILVPFLRAAGHEVHGLDLGLYEGCDLGAGPEDLMGRAPIDMRDVTAEQLAGFDAVACLAALSNDPLGHLNPATTYSVNLEGTLNLARAAKAAGIERFAFRVFVQPLRCGRFARSHRRRRPFPGHPIWRDQSPRRARALHPGRRQFQPDLPSQRHGLRRLTTAAPRHRGQ